MKVQLSNIQEMKFYKNYSQVHLWPLMPCVNVGKGDVLLMCDLSLFITEKCYKVEFPKFYVISANLKNLHDVTSKHIRSNQMYG